MKKSIVSAGLMVLGALLLIAPTRVQDGGATPTPAAPPAASPTPVAQAIAQPPGEIAVDPNGDNIGMILSAIVNQGTYGGNVQITVQPPTLNKSGVYFPVYVGSPTPAPATVNLTVPATAMVAFCSGGSTYDKATGKCADGKFPYKMVPTGSLTDPAAQTATIVCTAPKVPTWNPAMKQWNCIVPTGFKSTL